jgi:chemotaxis protein methyltransferase CheR
MHAQIDITAEEFAAFQRWLYQTAGVKLSDEKRTLVCSRLNKRLRVQRKASYGEYLRLIQANPAELRIALDLLTTHETYFYRESKHFDFLRERLVPAHPPGRLFRAWSAACSTGEEPYSIAMVLAEHLTGTFEVLGSDISERVLEDARRGVYETSRVKDLPRQYLTKYCLKGVRSQEGMILIEPVLRERVQFRQVNLIGRISDLGVFDVIFLRNVMIYFDTETRRRVVNGLIPCLRGGGHLIVGHSENLAGLGLALRQVSSSIYQRP